MTADPLSVATQDPCVGPSTHGEIDGTESAQQLPPLALRSATRPQPWLPAPSGLDHRQLGSRHLDYHETALGDFALACYLKGLGVQMPDDRSGGIGSGDDGRVDEVLNVPWSGTGVALDHLAAPTPTAVDVLPVDGRLRYLHAVAPFDTHYHDIEVAPGVTNIDVIFSASAAFCAPLVQIALIERGRVQSILRCGRGTWRKRLTAQQGRARLDRILVTVTATTTGGDYQLHIKPSKPTPDVVVSRLNRPEEGPPQPGSPFLPWTSPDIWVDNGGDAESADRIYLNHDNRLTIRLCNAGNAVARHVFVEFWFQDASGEISPSGWYPVRNMNGVIQHLSGISLEAGAAQVHQVFWCPKPSCGSRHFLVRAVVRSLGDHNTDNKRVAVSFEKVAMRP